MRHAMRTRGVSWRASLLGSILAVVGPVFLTDVEEGTPGTGEDTRVLDTRGGVEMMAAYIAFQSRRTNRYPRWVTLPWTPILDVSVISQTGGKAIQLSRDEVLSASYFRGLSRWSPDKKWLAWSGESELFVSDAAGETRVVYRRGGVPKFSFEDPWCFAWAPDSARLAVGVGGEGKTAICHLDGTIEKEIQGMKRAELVDLDWSRRGLLIQVVDQGSGAFSVYSLELERPRLDRRRMLDFKGTVYGVRFSPTSKELVFVGKTEKGWSIYRMNADGKGLTEVVGNLAGDRPPKWHDPFFEGKYQGNRPRWSPDGQRLAYGDRGHIYVVNRDGTGLKDSTPSGAVADALVWSPEGKRIAFHSGKWNERIRRASSWDIWIMEDDGEDLRQLTTDPAADMYPEWAP